VESSISVTHAERSLQLKFALKVNCEHELNSYVSETIGELGLIYNEYLEVVDENWVLEVMSPFLKVKQG
jgi:hypothetical protein